MTTLAASLNLPKASDLPPQVTTAEKLIILIHGWQPKGSGSPYPEDSPIGDLREALLAAANSRANWEFWAYEWDKDAATGDAGPLGSKAVDNAGNASVNALYHGKELGVLLANHCDKLKEVHFIAHSAGSWCARFAASRLLQKNPYLIAQVTLLDPFIPGEAPDLSLPDQWKPLDVEAMNLLASSNHLGQIHRFENLYVVDSFHSPYTDALFGLTSQSFQTFAYFNSTDLNVNLTPCGYFGHDGPVTFYEETASWQTAEGCGSTGFHAGLLHTQSFRPKVQEQPIAVYNDGLASISISVVSGSPVGVDWYKVEDGSYFGSGLTLVLPNVAANAGEYVAKAYNSYGATFSDYVDVSQAIQERPMISGLAPTSLPESYQRQNLTIFGSGFTDSTILRFTWNGQDFDSQDSHFSYVSPSELQYDILVEDSTGTWTVTAIDGGLESAPFAFTVVNAGGGRQLLSLAIAGQHSVFENDSISLSATALYTDGTSAAVAPQWSENSSYATISGAGVFSASSVGSDQQATVTASYSEDGVTKSTTHVVDILNRLGGGDDVELIENGDFADNSAHWSRTGSFYADDRFDTSNSHPGYAYLSLSNGAPGNNLSGDLVQYVDIPSGATDVDLSYWYSVTTQETTTTEMFDTLDVDIINTSGAVLRAAGRINNLHGTFSGNTGEYDRVTIDLSAYDGQRIGIRYRGSTDSSLPTVFRIDDVSILATVPPILTGLSIMGASSVLENSSAQYEAVAFFADGSEEVVDADDWDEDSSYASISNDGLLSTEEVMRNRSVGIDAEYTQNGITKTAFKRVTIVNIQPAFTGLVITGPTSVNERDVAHYQAEALYSDGTSATVDPTWSVVSDFASISVGGSLGVGEVRSNQSVQLEASYTHGATTKSTTFEISIVNVSDPRIPVSLAIDGPAQIEEGSLASFTATVQYDDGSTALVDPSWADDSSVTTVSAAGTISAGRVLVDTNVVVSASYTEQSVTISDTAVLKVINDTASVFAIDQIGVTRVIVEGETAAVATIEVSNNETFPISFDIASTPQCPWVSASPTSGLVDQSPVPITLEFDSVNLPVGLYAAELLVVPNNTNSEPSVLPITLIVQPDLSAEPFTANQVFVSDFENSVVKTTSVAPHGGILVMGDFTGSKMVAGETLTSNSGEEDIYAALIGSQGEVKWLRQFGGEFEEQVAHCVPHPNGGWLFCGVFRGEGRFGSHTLSAAGDDDKRDAYLGRLSATGEILWVRRAGGAETDYGEQVAVDPEGNCYLGGEFTENCTFDGGSTTLTAEGTRFDCFVVKYSGTGVFQWALGAGGNDYDSFSALSTDSAGDVYFSGIFTGTAHFGSTSLTVQGSRSSDAFISKISSDGSFQWTRRFGEPATGDSSERIRFLKASSGAGIFFGGFFEGPWHLGDATLLNPDGDDAAVAGLIQPNGSIEWIRKVSASGWYANAEFKLAITTSDGGLLSIGEKTGTIEFGGSMLEQEDSDPTSYAFLARYDAEGEELWAIVIAGDQRTRIYEASGSESAPLNLWLHADGYLDLPGHGQFQPASELLTRAEFGVLQPYLKPVITRMVMGEGGFLIRFHGQPGAAYEVERTNDFTGWTTVQTGIFPEIGWILFEGSSPGDMEKAIYRLVLTK